MANEERSGGKSSTGARTGSGRQSTGQKVSDVMTPNPACVTEQDTIRQVARLMLDQDCGAVPVVDSSDKKKLIGMITDRDIVVRVVATGKDADKAKVSDAMTRDVHSVKEDESLDSVYQIMSKEQVRRVPVVGRNDEVIGIVAVADVATHDEDDGELARTVEKISDGDSTPNRR